MKNRCDICTHRNEACATEPKRGKCPSYTKDRFCLTCKLLGNGCPQGFNKDNVILCNCGSYEEGK